MVILYLPLMCFTESLPFCCIQETYASVIHALYSADVKTTVRPFRDVPERQIRLTEVGYGSVRETLPAVLGRPVEGSVVFLAILGVIP